MEQGNTLHKIPVGISSCLLGEEVRYDGGHKYNPYIVETMGQQFDFVPFCPEVDIELGVPREPIQLVADNGITRCVGTNTSSLDVTKRLSDCADNQRYWQERIYGYILKERSPSCGMEGVRLWRNAKSEPSGVGIYANRMMQNFPLLPVEEEGRLVNSRLHESFMRQVFTYYRWTQLCSSGLSWVALTEFHTSHMPILMQCNQAMACSLERELFDSTELNIDEYASRYIMGMMSILKVVVTHH